MYSANRQAANAYSNTRRNSAACADPHQLIVMLYDGAIARIAAAKGAIQRKDIPLKGQMIGKAITIVEGLRGCLDHEKGGEISDNLFNLYDYMERRLLQANMDSSLEMLDEVVDLINDIRGAWVEIGPQVKQVSSQATVNSQGGFQVTG